MSRPRLLVRPRLVERLAERWCRRVVTIVGGPGFGKSVLLAQSWAEHVLAPRGEQLTVSCTPADRSPEHFLGRIADALGPDAGADAPAAVSAAPDRVLAELARRWPMGVCLVVDDVHHVVATDDGARLLARLAVDAPPPVHLVLAGRRPVRGLGRLRASGDLLEIGERELSLTPEESDALALAHGVDASLVAATGGWPAVASLAASYGVVGAEGYVWDEVLAHLDERCRRVVAVATAIGRSDRELLQAAVGDVDVDAAAVLADVPLVGGAPDGVFEVHDLWDRVVAGALTRAELVESVVRAVDVLVDRREVDRAFGLCAEHGLWEDAARVLTACCRRGFVDVPTRVLAGWLDALPATRWDEPDGLLLRGVVGRISDPFGPATTDCLERAAIAFRERGNVAGEVAAASELAVVLRSQGRADAMPALLTRAVELHVAGHREVDGPMTLVRSVAAELGGDDERMLAELDALPAGSLSLDWQAVVAFRQAIGQLTLGDEDRMLAAAARCAELAGSTTFRHVLPLARWFAGDPRPALDSCASIVADAGRSQVDGVALGSFATMVLATSGRVGEAAIQLATAQRAATGGSVLPLMRGYLTGIAALVAAATGDDDGARGILERALAEAPLGDSTGWRMATRWLALAYVLVPSSRPELDRSELGPLHRRRVAVGRAVAASREGRPIDATALADVSAGLVATTVPLPWSMTLASRLTADGVALGREIGEALFDLCGSPARRALRDIADRSVHRLAAGARKLLASITMAPSRQVRLEALGPAVLRVGGRERGDLDWQRERVRSLLLYLAVNGAVRRDEIAEALWPGLEAAAADRNLRVTLSYLQRVLEPERRRGEAPFLLRQSGATLSLAGAPHLVVDIDEFETLVDRAEDADRRGIPSVARELFEQAVGRWRGRCLADVAYEEWAQTTFHDLTARFVRAAVRAAELALAAGDTAAARRLARRALGADTWSEAAHRVLIAAALDDGDRPGARRALADCDGALRDLGVAEDAATAMLRRRVGSSAVRLPVSA